MRYAISTKDELGDLRTFVVEPLGCEGDMLVAMRNGIKAHFALGSIRDWYPVEERQTVGLPFPGAAKPEEKSVFDLCF